MKSQSCWSGLAAVLLACALSACSPNTPSAQNTATGSASITHPRIQKSLDLYRGLRAKGSYALAAPIGAGVVTRHPHSAAALEIKKTLADTQKRADAINETRRLGALWLYQRSTQSGDQQNTASISPSTPAAYRDRIELVLRRHAEWGQSVYLYDHGGNGFVCKGHCKLVASFDGSPHALVGYLPQTGDPALFIDHDKRFLAAMTAAHTVSIQVHLKDGATPTLTFEVGGFEPDKWPQPARK